MKNKKSGIMLGEKLSPVFEELEEALWDFEVNFPNEPARYSIFGFRGAIKIFMSALLDKMWEKQEAKLVPQKERQEKAQKAGEEVMEFIKRYTGIDSHDLYKI